MFGLKMFYYQALSFREINFLACSPFKDHLEILYALKFKQIQPTRAIFFKEKN